MIFVTNTSQCPSWSASPVPDKTACRRPTNRTDFERAQSLKLNGFSTRSRRHNRCAAARGACQGRHPGETESTRGSQLPWRCWPASGCCFPPRSTAQVGWGPYGWYPPFAYAYGRSYLLPLRLQIAPRDTETFVYGYYAGIVDDFDGYIPAPSSRAGPTRHSAVPDGPPHGGAADLSAARRDIPDAPHDGSAGRR